VEAAVYRLCGVTETEEQTWTRYLVGVLALSVLSTLLTYLQLRVQQNLPFNPAGFGPVGPDLSLNTAISFTTNTSWQSYSGEQTMSYLSQMLAIGLPMFLSGATGMAVAIALIRGFSRRNA